MGTLKYFADNADKTETKEYKKISYRDKNGFWGWDEDSKVWVKITRQIEYKSNASKHKCDSRCQLARGRSMKCECACGGKNHGKA